MEVPTLVPTTWSNLNPLSGSPTPASNIAFFCNGLPIQQIGMEGHGLFHPLPWLFNHTHVPLDSWFLVQFSKLIMLLPTKILPLDDLATPSSNLNSLSCTISYCKIYTKHSIENGKQTVCSHRSTLTCIGPSACFIGLPILWFPWIVKFRIQLDLRWDEADFPIRNKRIQIICLFSCLFIYLFFKILTPIISVKPK